MSLFRKTALDALSTPERLDQPLRLLRPGQWLLLFSLGGFCITVVVWSMIGRLPVRISGRGVLIHQNTLTSVQSETTGQVQSLAAKVGDCLKVGQVMARVEPVQEEVQQEQSRIQLQQLIDQDRQEDQLADIRLRQLESEIGRVKNLGTIGAMSVDEISRRQRELSTLQDNLTSRNSQREQQITQQRTRIQSLEQSIQRKALVRSPIDGCVVNRQINQGEVVQPGTTLYSMTTQTDRNDLESIAFFSAGDGKRLKTDLRVRIIPDNTKQQRHGGIEGRVVSIRRLPVTEAALVKRLGHQSLLDSLKRELKGPLIEVTTSMERDPSTITGYNWGGGPGPKLKLTAGTPTSVRVLVEERRPISYVIPLLRDLTGIY